jgi:hypothetical protein
MKKLTPIILLLMVSLSQAAMISFQMTNSVTGLPDTNVIQVFSCGPVQANGTVYTTGLGKRVQPNTNGYAVIKLEQNNYLATNAYLGRGYIFRAPLDSSTNNTYQSAGASCLISGLNYFVNLVVGDATNQNVTLNQVTNALGFTPVSAAQSTNIVLSLANYPTNYVTNSQPLVKFGAITNGASRLDFDSLQYWESYPSIMFVDWGERILFGAEGQSSLRWNQRTAFDTNGYTAMNWNTRQLHGDWSLYSGATFNGDGITNLSASQISSGEIGVQFLPSSITNQGAWSTNFTLSTSNTLFTNLVAQINTSSNALKSFLTASNALLASNLLSTSNALWWAKQPASTTLSNLAGTGAFTNELAAGTNVLITTNLTGAHIVYIHATNQTFLTNGFTSIVYSNGSTFLTTNLIPGLTNNLLAKSWTNSLGTAAYVSTNAFDTNGASAAVKSAILSSNYLLASFTNSLASTNYVNASTNGFVTSEVTNGLASIAYVTNLVQASTNGILSGAYVSSNSILLWSTNIANGVYSNNPAGYSTTASLNSASNYLSTNILAQIIATNRANLVITTNLVIASTNAGNIVFTNDPRILNAITNVGQFQLVTNGFAQGFFGLSSQTNFLISTNLIGITGAGSAEANGTYQFNPGGFANTWTNVWATNMLVLLSGGSFYVQSNGVSLYSASSVAGSWNVVNGVTPVPSASYGSYWNMNGVIMTGPLSSTNLAWQIGQYVSTNGGAGSTNFTLSGVVQSWTTNNQFSTTGTNVIVSLIGQYGVNPTNGVSAVTVTNIAASLINTATNSLWAGVTNRGAVMWGTTTNLTSLARPATLYYFVTNNIPQYGILYTN